MKLLLQSSEVQSVMKQYNPQNRKWNAYKSHWWLGTETKTLMNIDLKLFERCN